MLDGLNKLDSLLKFEIPEIIFGRGSIEQLGQCSRRLGGDKVMVVTDPGIIANGWIDEALGHLQREGLKAVVYDHVVSNPRAFHVEQGAEEYTRQECDVIIAIGGGSPMDTAKGVAILASNQGRIVDYVGCNLITQPIPPLICVPTTAGTGSDVSQFAIIADQQKKIKMTILSRAIMPDISLIDPRLLQTKSDELIASTGMDALTHAIEAFVSSLSWPLTDPHASHAIKLVFRHLTDAVHKKSIDPLEGMAIASLEAGAAFSNAILGAVHALAHPLGGLYDIHHGLANAILLPTVLRKNLEYAPDKYALVANAMGVDTRGKSKSEAAGQVPEKIEALIKNLDIPTKLSQVGVRRQDIHALAQDAAEDLCMMTNPQKYDAQEIEAIYLDAL
jgi:1,3-propanediol dehydrogenase